MMPTFNSLPNDKFSDRSKLKASADDKMDVTEKLQFNPFPNDKFTDDSCQFDENGRKFSKPVENAVGKEEIALYEHFLLFPQCFQKDL